MKNLMMEEKCSRLLWKPRILIGVFCFIPSIKGFPRNHFKGLGVFTELFQGCLLSKLVELNGSWKEREKKFLSSSLVPFFVVLIFKMENVSSKWLELLFSTNRTSRKGRKNSRDKSFKNNIGNKDKKVSHISKYKNTIPRFWCILNFSFTPLGLKREQFVKILTASHISSLSFFLSTSHLKSIHITLTNPVATKSVKNGQTFSNAMQNCLPLYREAYNF